MSKDDLQDFLNQHIESEVERLKNKLGLNEEVNPNTGMTESQEIEYCVTNGILMEPFKNNRTKEDLFKIAQGMIDNTIFSSMFLNNKDAASLGTVFMPLLFSVAASFRLAKYGGTVFAYMSEALPRGVNGYPCFTTMHILNKEDTETVVKFYNKINEMTESLKEEVLKE